MNSAPLLILMAMKPWNSVILVLLALDVILAILLLFSIAVRRRKMARAAAAVEREAEPESAPVRARQAAPVHDAWSDDGPTVAMSAREVNAKLGKDPSTAPLPRPEPVRKARPQSRQQMNALLPEPDSNPGIIAAKDSGPRVRTPRKRHEPERPKLPVGQAIYGRAKDLEMPESALHDWYESVQKTIPSRSRKESTRGELESALATWPKCQSVVKGRYSKDGKPSASWLEHYLWLRHYVAKSSSLGYGSDVDAVSRYMSKLIDRLHDCEQEYGKALKAVGPESRHDVRRAIIEAQLRFLANTGDGEKFDRLFWQVSKASLAEDDKLQTRERPVVPGSCPYGVLKGTFQRASRGRDAREAGLYMDGASWRDFDLRGHDVLGQIDAVLGVLAQYTGTVRR